MPGAGDPKDSGSPQPGFGPIDDAPRSGEVSVLLRRTVVWQDIFFQIEVFYWKGTFLLPETKKNLTQRWAPLTDETHGTHVCGPISPMSRRGPIGEQRPASREIFVGSAEGLTTRIPKLQQTRVFALGDALVVRGDQVVHWEDGGS
jgi:hypothetical protein